MTSAVVPSTSVRKPKPNKISYVVPFPSNETGHRLGINALVLDTDASTFDHSDAGILYSGGRDGAIKAWDLHLSLDEVEESAANEYIHQAPNNMENRRWKVNSSSKTQAHTHWINDLCLAHNGTSVLSVSSDLTVKLWRTHSEHNVIPQTIGYHSDYVKCLTTSGSTSDWVASGGLDRKIRIWDLEGKGERLVIGEKEGVAEDPKASVYALKAAGGILASGGPDSIVRIWDPRSGERITSFLGHSDNVRSILLSDDGQICMSASADASIKMWDLRIRRCLHTLTMHTDSIWTLHSLHPRLEVFHSGDRSGLVVKTDIRGIAEVEDADAMAVAKEVEGIRDIVGVGNRLWTATSSSSINRWLDAPDWNPLQHHRGISRLRASSNARSQGSIDRTPTIPSPTTSSVEQNSPGISHTSNKSQQDDSVVLDKCRLRLTAAVDTFFTSTEQDQGVSGNANPSPSQPSSLKALIDDSLHLVRDNAEETIAGQHGIVRYISLNDRRRVLTLDTAGDVAIWDIINSFGSVGLDDIERQLNTTESVATWCQIDTRTGALTVMLDENRCFDAEVYADETLADHSHLREDQRINLGKWILKHLFKDLVAKEIINEKAFRHKAEETAFDRALEVASQRAAKREETANEEFSENSHTSLSELGKLDIGTDTFANGDSLSPIGIASSLTSPDDNTREGSVTPTVKTPSANTKGTDYFSSVSNDLTETSTSPITPNTGSSLMNRFKSFGVKKPSKSQDKEEHDTVSNSIPHAVNNPTSPTTAPNPVESSTHSGTASTIPSSEVDQPEAETGPPVHNFGDVLYQMQEGYNDALDELIEKGTLEKETYQSNPLITPIPDDDCPPIDLPPNTAIFISEEEANTSGSKDVYRGTVETVARDVETLENVAPSWLGELLLQNRMPPKEISKISFVLKPSGNLSDLSSGLNANRMLRARKILTYVMERLEPSLLAEHANKAPSDWLELLCLDKIIPPKSTLAMIRLQIWRNSGDIILHYRLKENIDVS